MNIEAGLQIKRGPGRPAKGLFVGSGIATKALSAVDAEKVAHWAYRLELANAMKAGLMDSESRHDEVARQRIAIIDSVIAEMRAL